MTDQDKKPDSDDATEDAAGQPNVSNASDAPDAPSQSAATAIEIPSKASTKPSSSSSPNTVLHSRPPLSRSGVAGLLLALVALLATAGITAVGYLITQNAENQRFALEQKLDNLNQTVSGLNVDSKGRSQWFDGMQQRSEKIDRGLETLNQQQAADQAHLQRLDGSMATLAKQVQGGQHAWQRAEVEHLLLVANTRLQLQQDLKGAKIALTLAQERLTSLANPAYFPVAEQITRELTRLEAVQLPNIPALALKLSSLTDQVDALHTRQTYQGAFETNLQLSSGPEQLQWHQRLWVSLNETVGSLVSIRRDVERREPLLPPDQGFYLRQNLRLQLESARLALLRQDSANFKAALRQADQWLQQYFDQAHAATKAARASIQSLNQQTIESQLPDISGSLTALRAVGSEA